MLATGFSEVSALLVAALTVGSGAGVAWAVARRQSTKDIVDGANQRAADWRDTAEQRMAELVDKDRALADLRKEYELERTRLQSELTASREQVSLLKQRPDLDGLVDMTKQAMKANTEEHRAIIAQIASVAELLAKKGAS